MIFTNWGARTIKSVGAFYIKIKNRRMFPFANKTKFEFIGN